MIIKPKRGNCRAPSAGLPNDQRLPPAPFEGARRVVPTVLKLCETAGLVKLGHVALDGTKIKANASKHKAMSYERPPPIETNNKSLGYDDGRACGVRWIY